MKLQMKDLTPYLPYDLKMQVVTGGGQPNDTFTKIHKLTPTFLVTCISDDIYRRISCKPLLRPMGDALTNCLNIDGEDIYFSTWVCKKTGIEIDRWLDFEIPVGNNDRDDTLYFPLLSSLKVYNLLLEYHFDVFGLIDKGLALPLETSKN